jgi:hypothetical protein
MGQILALDPCRRFTFGVTVENTGIHIWFCDRSGYMVSDLIEYLDSVRLDPQNVFLTINCVLDSRTTSSTSSFDFQL